MIEAMLILGILSLLCMIVAAIGLILTAGSMFFMIPTVIGMVLGAIVVIIAIRT